MSFSSGVFTLTAGNPVVTGTTISSTWANSTLSDIATGLSSCVLKDGTQTVTANLPMSTFKLTGMGAGNVAGDWIRYEQVLDTAGLTLAGPLNQVRGADIASAATVNLTTATGNVVDVTGTTGITAITLASGNQRWVRFTGALTITNGASLVLPGGADIVTAAGDYALFIGYAAGVVRCAAFIPVAGGSVPFTDTNPIVMGSADKTKKVRMEVDGLTTGTTRVITVPDVDLTLPYKPGTLGSIQTYTTTGANTWTKPAGLVRVRVVVVAAGGGGGGTQNGVGTAAGGGGAGSTSIKLIAAASLGTTETATVGAGGTAGTSGGGTGGTGGTSSFGAHASCTGGVGGTGAGSGTSTAPGAGGSASSGDINVPGGDGFWGVAASNIGGQGAPSYFGGGGVGGAAANGTAGKAYGSGGGGGGSNGGAAAVGGAGKDGIIYVEEFF